ncbi:MAG: nucleoside hydrolase [Chloroflexi bacterium]|nr:nucleoside hydrolase [Chloroflexota bacterium]MCY3582674.1 nucleoside hydrolase [Chloroflexota bacterium]MCY3717789.1 nucleoside hydrolase [Chloroflexota bacterium]MDE2651458.1 nucleoside hydrolase [Chloroflexota bacterium]MXX84553.1 nucleoside hydrolase [Chloroflexota bacterium]
MTFPDLSDAFRLQRLQPPLGKARMVLDTDTYNEIDDQFALVYALLSPQELAVEAIYAAPFHNSRSDSPADGMLKSYEEILRLLDFLHIAADGFVFRGADRYLGAGRAPVESAAVRDLIDKALASPDDDPLYVVAIGAITNVASALLLAPEIIGKIVVVWLGGHALHWRHSREFNLAQDVPAAQVLLDSGVPLVIVPCLGVSSHLLTSLPELRASIGGRSAVGDYLCQIFAEYRPEGFAASSVIWDISTIAWLINADWLPSELRHSPVLTDQVTWSIDRSRHLVRVASFVQRDPVFRDMFSKIRALGD